MLPKQLHWLWWSFAHNYRPIQWLLSDKTSLKEATVIFFVRSVNYATCRPRLWCNCWRESCIVTRVPSSPLTDAWHVWTQEPKVRAIVKMTLRKGPDLLFEWRSVFYLHLCVTHAAEKYEIIPLSAAHWRSVANEFEFQWRTMQICSFVYAAGAFCGWPWC